MKIYWTKIYSNNSTLTELQIASWSKSKLTDMIGATISVELDNEELLVVPLLKGLGEYHQSDDYQITFPSKIHRLTKRRLQFHQENGTWLTKEIDMANLDIKLYTSPKRI